MRTVADRRQDVLQAQTKLDSVREKLPAANEAAQKSQDDLKGDYLDLRFARDRAQEKKLQPHSTLRAETVLKQPRHAVTVTKSDGTQKTVKAWEPALATAIGVMEHGAEGAGASLLPFAALPSVVDQAGPRWGIAGAGGALMSVPVLRSMLVNTNKMLEGWQQSALQAGASAAKGPASKKLVTDAVNDEQRSIETFAGAVINLGIASGLIQNGVVSGVGVALLALSLLSTKYAVFRTERAIKALGPGEANNDAELAARTYDLAALDQTLAEASEAKFRETMNKQKHWSALPNTFAVGAAVGTLVSAFFLFHKIAKAESSTDTTDTASAYQAGQVYPAAVNLLLMAKDLIEFTSLRMELVDKRAKMEAEMLHTERNDAQTDLSKAENDHQKFRELHIFNLATLKNITIEEEQAMNGVLHARLRLYQSRLFEAHLPPIEEVSDEDDHPLSPESQQRTERAQNIADLSRMPPFEDNEGPMLA